MSDMHAAGHQPHEKVLGFGVELTGDIDDPVFLDMDDPRLDDLWADACTVEEFAEQLEALKNLPEEEIEVLKRDREEKWF
jgi:hypothetical protein